MIEQTKLSKLILELKILLLNKSCSGCLTIQLNLSLNFDSFFFFLQQCESQKDNVILISLELGILKRENGWHLECDWSPLLLMLTN